LLTLFVIQLNVRARHAIPLAVVSSVNTQDISSGGGGPPKFLAKNNFKSNAIVFEDNCMALDQTLFKLREILRITTATEDDTTDSTAFDDYYSDRPESSTSGGGGSDKSRVFSSIKFSIAKSTSKVCKIEIKINRTIAFEFFDLYLLNQTLTYFILNSKQNEVPLNGNVYFVYNFNYCHAKKYYSVTLSHAELETLQILDQTLQKHSGILAENCRNAAAPFSTISKVSSKNSASLFRPNLVLKNANFENNSEERSANSELVFENDQVSSDEKEQPEIDEQTKSKDNVPPVGQTSRQRNKTSGEEAAFNSSHQEQHKLGSMYLISTKVLTYLIIVFIVLFMVNLAFKFNKYYFQNKFKERLDKKKPISGANSIYFNPFEFNLSAAASNLVSNENKETSEENNTKTEDTDEMTNMNFVSSRLQTTNSDTLASKSKCVTSEGSSENDNNPNPVNSKSANTVAYLDTDTTTAAAEYAKLDEVCMATKFGENRQVSQEGDKRSEHSVTDRAKMKYVEEWLSSISRVKYFIINTGQHPHQPQSNYEAYYCNSTNSKRSVGNGRRQSYRSVNL
jgi:hypothetical protein